MKKILVTGFVPFNGESINPAGEVANRLKAPEGTEMWTVILPVEYASGLAKLKEEIRDFRPDYVVSFGQGGIRPALTPEKIAINFATTRSTDGRTLIADEAGQALDDVPLDENAPIAYYSTLPIRKMCSASWEAGTPAGLSYSAGTYLCNAVMYTSLHLAAEEYPKMKCGFIHLPFLPEQLKMELSVTQWPMMYSMPLEEMVRGAQAMIDCLAQDENV